MDGKGRSRQTKAPSSFRVRDRVRFLYETALRPGTVAALEVPRHWKPGDRAVTITADVDKCGNARPVPLTKAALDVLERCAPERCPIFGKHAIRLQIKRAAAKVLDPVRAKDFSLYDFRHGRAVHALDASKSNLLGIAHLLGHKKLSTTDRYLRTSVGHAASMVTALDRKWVTARSPSVPTSRTLA